MSTAALGLYEPEHRRDVLRWSIAALVVIAVHLGVAVAYLALRPASFEGQAQAPIIEVEFAPAPAEPTAPPVPEMPPVRPTDQQEPPPPPQPEPPPETQAMQPPPTEPAVEVPSPPKPMPIEKPKEKPAHVAPVQPPSRREHEPLKRPANTTAPHAAPQRLAAAPNPGASALGAREAQASWRSALAAHIARYKRYPAEAEARHDTGTVRLSFTMDRGGRVLSRHIETSSGSAALDHEVLSMIERAQPLPAFPPAMPQTRMTLVVPIHFSLQ
jgi:periplasmic protein TonB